MVLNEAIARCWELLRMLGRCLRSLEPKDWMHGLPLHPRSERHAELAQRVSMPAPPGEWQGWNAFDYIKFRMVGSRSVALVLQRTAQLGVALHAVRSSVFLWPKDLKHV